MIESGEHGYFGGYLIVSVLGRPIEFHCTAPVRPSRAQRILYGPTLEPFLLGEQIAGTLLQAAKLTPSLILVNCDAALHIRSRSKVPMVLLGSKPEHSLEESLAPETSKANASTPEAADHFVNHADVAALGMYAFQ